MLKNYFVVAIRSLTRSKLYSSINIIGLAVGMSCCILITLFVLYELSYDKGNRRADQVYRMTVDLEANNWAISAFRLGAWMKENLPEVETYTRIMPRESFVQNSANLVKHKEKIFYSDSTLFDVLDIKLVLGDAATALDGVDKMVLTAEKAKAYFGDDDPIGKTLTMLSDKVEYKITGILPTPPAASHLHIDMAVTSNNSRGMNPKTQPGWGNLTNHYTYVVLPKQIDHIAFEKKVSTALDKFQELKPTDNPSKLHAQPLTSIHLASDLGLEIEANGSSDTVYILSAIAFFILIIACINFMNLTTAQSLRRTREVGIRKAVGSKRTQLIFQFLTESVLISMVALFISIIIVSLIMPSFNTLVEKNIPLNPFVNIAVPISFGAIAIFVGLLSGTYPAFFLSSFKPTAVLKGNFVAGTKGQLLRKGLVVFQFAVAFIIMVGTYVIHDQLDFMLNKDTGFSRAQKLIVPLPDDSLARASFKTESLRIAGVDGITTIVELPGQMVRTTNFWYEGLAEDNGPDVYVFTGDEDLIQTMGMKMLYGRYFESTSKNYGKEFVINEAAVRSFGWKPEEAVGKMMDFGNRGTIPGKVIGVVKDFNFKHLQEAVDPMVMDLSGNLHGGFMILSLKSNDIDRVVADVQSNWKQFYHDRDFEYKFLDETFNNLFQREAKLSKVFGIFSALAILISCLGLFGLASFTIEQTKKSVAVRKVLGATAANIVTMMSRDFLILVFGGMVVAAPIGWYVMSRWLSGFAFNSGFKWQVFLYAGVAGLLVAFAAVSYHAIKAAISNPVNALKDQ